MNSEYIDDAKKRLGSDGYKVFMVLMRGELTDRAYFYATKDKGGKELVYRFAFDGIHYFDTVEEFKPYE